MEEKQQIIKCFYNGWQHHFWCQRCNKWHAHGKGSPLSWFPAGNGHQGMLS